jgi:hypothetical protein
MMGFFTEQFAVPDKVTYNLPERLPGSLTEVSRQGGGFVQREIQAQVYISPGIAKTLITWLEEKVAEAEEAQKLIAEAEATGVDSTNDAVDTVIVEAKDDN